MEIYVRVMVRSNIARRQKRNINNAPERVHVFPYLTKNVMHDRTRCLKHCVNTLIYQLMNFSYCQRVQICFYVFDI